MNYLERVEQEAREAILSSKSSFACGIIVNQLLSKTERIEVRHNKVEGNTLSAIVECVICKMFSSGEIVSADCNVGGYNWYWCTSQIKKEIREEIEGREYEFVAQSIVDAFLSKCPPLRDVGVTRIVRGVIAEMVDNKELTYQCFRDNSATIYSCANSKIKPVAESKPHEKKKNYYSLLMQKCYSFGGRADAELYREGLMKECFSQRLLGEIEGALRKMQESHQCFTFETLMLDVCKSLPKLSERNSDLLEWIIDEQLGILVNIGKIKQIKGHGMHSLFEWVPVKVYANEKSCSTCAKEPNCKLSCYKKEVSDFCSKQYTCNEYSKGAFQKLKELASKLNFRRIK